MKLNALFALVAFFGAVLFSYSTASAQSEDKTKETKSANAVVAPEKKVTKAVAEPVTKTTVVVTDTLTNAADKTKDAAASTTSTVATKSQTIGKTTINVTEGVKGDAYEGGRWLTTSTWDGSKWVYKRLWFPNKKQ